MNPDGDADPSSPAEERLLRHLGALREHPPEPDPTRVAAVVRTARWQAAVRPFAQAAGRMIAAMGESTRVRAAQVRS